MAGRRVAWVACDITTPAGRAAAIKACPAPDILVNNAGGPPPGDSRDFDRDAWIRALDANILMPIELIKATIDSMIARRFGRIVNITSAAVKAPIDALGLSNGARSGLTGFVAGVARKVAKHNVTINNLLPGYFDTDRFEGATTARHGRGQATRRRRHGARRCPGGPHRHAGGVRRRLRVPLQRRCGLHHRPERADRRRRLSRYLLTARSGVG
jgi:3-oxoacyl-[acyl-carrier protein] reductase